ncbi:MAG: PCMD domain-containing protein [Bacteroidota bacterium]
MNNNLKNTFLMTALLVFFISSCKKEQDQPIEETLPTQIDSNDFNFSFDRWSIITSNTLVYEEPSGSYWTSLNYLSRLACPVTVSKTTDTQNGNFAACLETMQWGSVVIPGLLVMGTFIPQEPFVIQGKPFIRKPSSINGFYKYLPIDSDTCVLYARLSRYNSGLNRRDTIAEAHISSSQIISTYQSFSLIFDYKNTVLIPDSLTILFVSSIDGVNFRGHPGSKLFIDNLSLVFP